MKLYFSNGSPFARKVRIVLAEKGLDYEKDVYDAVRPIDVALGPTLAIPVLDDAGRRLWESDLIIDYLLQTYPDARATAGAAASPPLAPWTARPDRHWDDMLTLATIASCSDSIVNMRLMVREDVTPDNSVYMARQRTRVERCLDWLETRVTDEGFAPGWYSVMDIAFFCPMAYCETRGIMPWRGRQKLEALFERCATRPSALATPINDKPLRYAWEPSAS